MKLPERLSIVKEKHEGIFCVLVAKAVPEDAPGGDIYRREKVCTWEFHVCDADGASGYIPPHSGGEFFGSAFLPHYCPFCGGKVVIKTD